MILLDVTALDRAGAAIRGGAVVAFPTETFYGLAVDATDEAALARLFALKGRPDDKATALLVTDLEMFAELCSDVPPRARQLAAKHWPGPLTLVLPARPGLPDAIVQDGCVGARVSSHPVAQALVRSAGRPITATSANPAGKPAARDARLVASYFADRSYLLLDGGPTPGGSPSTLVRVTGEAVEVLRPGPVIL